MTTCIFNFTGDECIGNNEKRMNLTHLICQCHLRDLYGVELEHIKFEGETYYTFVGGILKPIEKTIFKPNCVIFPERQFFDKYFDTVGKTPDDEQYVMNPNIVEFMRQISLRKRGIQPSDRFTIEIYRNLPVSTKDVNVGQAKEPESTKSKALALVHSNRPFLNLK